MGVTLVPPPALHHLVAAGERPVEGEESLDPTALGTEAVMLGVRTADGIDLDALMARYGVDLLAANEALVARLVAEDHVAVHPGPEGGRRLVPTASGLAVADGMAAAFEIPLPSPLDQ